MPASKYPKKDLSCIDSFWLYKTIEIFQTMFYIVFFLYGYIDMHTRNNNHDFTTKVELDMVKGQHAKQDFTVNCNIQVQLYINELF